MANYGDMKSRIADEIADSTLTSQIVLAINSAIKHHERREFYFNTKVGTFLTVAAQEYYGSAANADIPSIIRILGMKVTSGGYKYDVTGSPFSEIDSAQDGTLTGTPRNYSYFSERIRLYPIPAAVETITMAYVYRLTALSADSDSNAWTDDAEELIRQRAKLILATDTLRDIDMAQAAGVMESTALNALLKETKLRKGVSSLTNDMPSGGRYNIYTDR